jgi:hypothetical protein
LTHRPRKNTRQTARQHVNEFVGEQCRRLVCKRREDDLFERMRLLGDRVRNLRLRMTMQCYPPRRNPIENTTTVVRDKVRTFATHCMQRRWPCLVLRIWMPNVLGIRCDNSIGDSGIKRTRLHKPENKDDL